MSEKCVLKFDRIQYEKDASQLKQMLDINWNNNHYKCCQKITEFWLKYDKLYYLMNDDEKYIFNRINFDETYRRKHYFTEKEEEKFIEQQYKLIPDNYFDN